MVIDPRSYRWSNASFARPRFRDLVIYGLHVGTFTPSGTFRGVVERLQYLTDLGVNTIELMPIAEFAGVRNWGYDGVALYAPAHVYGTPDDLRTLVDAAHQAGIAVILDVVYNHFGPVGNYLASFIGDYLDEETRTPWGGAIKYGRLEFRPLREFVIDNAAYWMDEFRIDGFRFDATHAIADDSPRHLLAELTEMVHSRGGYAIAEDARNEANLMSSTSCGGLGFDALWADDFHHVVRVSMTGETESYLGDFAGSVAELVKTLNQGWLYCGQYSPFLGVPRGTSPKELGPGSFIHCISNHDQVGNRAFGERLSDSTTIDSYLAASALVCLSPHIPLLFMGQEWAASTPFLFFTDHNEQLGPLVTAGRREEFAAFSEFQSDGAAERIPDPQDPRTFEASRLRWDEIELLPHSGVLALYRTCLALRKQHAAFRPSSTSSWWAREMSSGITAIWLKSASDEWLLLVDLVGNHHGVLAGLPFVLSSTTWRRVLSTRDQRFGGDGSCALTEPFESVHFDRAETLLLQRVEPQPT